MAKRTNEFRILRAGKNPYQLLANAIILQAIKDYRSRSRMMKKISRSLNSKRKSLTVEERNYLQQRFAYYYHIQDEAADFFFSDLFSTLCDLNGYDILTRLNQEAQK